MRSSSKNCPPMRARSRSRSRCLRRTLLQRPNGRRSFSSAAWCTKSRNARWRANTRTCARTSPARRPRSTPRSACCCSRRGSPPTTSATTNSARDHDQASAMPCGGSPGKRAQGVRSRRRPEGRGREGYQAAAMLYRPGDPAEDFFVLESGRVEFLIGRGDRTAPGGFMLKKGEVFGWAALLDGYPARIASARCLEESALLRINGKAALRVLEGDSAAGFIVMRRLAALIARYLASSGAK